MYAKTNCAFFYTPMYMILSCSGVDMFTLGFHEIFSNIENMVHFHSQDKYLQDLRFQLSVIYEKVGQNKFQNLNLK